MNEILRRMEELEAQLRGLRGKPDGEGLQGRLVIWRDPRSLGPTLKITVGTTEPTAPEAGDLWVDTN